jgi:hypothetical protein
MSLNKKTLGGVQMFEANSNSLVSYLFEAHAQEVNFIRSEMHEEQQRLDREQIEQEEAEENERQYRETMQRLGLVHDPAPIESDDFVQVIGASIRRMQKAGTL